MTAIIGSDLRRHLAASLAHTHDTGVLIRLDVSSTADTTPPPIRLLKTDADVDAYMAQTRAKRDAHRTHMAALRRATRNGRPF